MFTEIIQNRTVVVIKSWLLTLGQLEQLTELSPDTIYHLYITDTVFYDIRKDCDNDYVSYLCDYHVFGSISIQDSWQLWESNNCLKTLITSLIG
jgi:hypothetical protein